MTLRLRLIKKSTDRIEERTYILTLFAYSWLRHCLLPVGASEGVDAKCHCLSMTLRIDVSSGLNSTLQQWRNKDFRRLGTEAIMCAPRFFEGVHVQGLKVHVLCFAVK